MNMNKKYAIRKLSMGVASVAIGLFMANNVDVVNNITGNHSTVYAGEVVKKGLDSEPWTTTKYVEGMAITKDPGDKYGYFTDYKVDYVFKFRYFEEDGSITYRYLKSWTKTDSNGEPRWTYIARFDNESLPEKSDKMSAIIGDKNKPYGEHEVVNTATESARYPYGIPYTEEEPTLSPTGETIPSANPPQPDFANEAEENQPVFQGDKNKLFPGDKSINYTVLSIGLRTEVVKEKVKDRNVQYIKGENLPPNEKKTIQEGKDKIKITTTEYEFKDQKLTNEEYNKKINEDRNIPTVENGEVKRTVTETFEEAEDKIIEVGTPKNKEEIKSIKSPVKYVKDDTRKKGEPDLRTEGTEGSSTTPISYEVNRITGDVEEVRGKEVIISPTPTIIKVAAKDEIVYSKRGDDIIKTTTRYEVDENDGHLTPKVEEEIYKKDGAKTKVVTTPIDSPVVYEKDSTRSKGTPDERIEGVKGSSTVTTTYEVNPENGELIEKVSEPVIISAKPTVIKIGAKDEVVEEVIPSRIRYIKDDTRKKGEPFEVVTQGKAGKKTTITKYEIDRETGKITSKVGEPIIEPSTETVIKVPATDAEKVYLEGDNEVKEITKYEVDENTGKIKETVTKEIIGTREKILPPVLEVPEYDKPISTNTPVDDNGELILPPVVEELPTLKVGIIQDKEGNVLDVIKVDEEPKEIEGYTNTGKVETDKDGNKVYTYEKNATSSNGTELPPVVEELPVLKVGIIKDTEGNVIDVIKFDEEPKEIEGYTNTGKVEMDKDGNKVYIYEKVKQDNKKEEPKVEIPKVETPKQDNTPKKDLPKTIATQSTAYVLGMLLGISGLKFTRDEK